MLLFMYYGNLADCCPNLDGLDAGRTGITAKVAWIYVGF